MVPHFASAQSASPVTSPSLDEDYARARVLARFDHLGIRFRVVRMRYQGKPWGCRTCVLVDGVQRPVADDVRRNRISGPSTVADWQADFERMFPITAPGARDRLLSALKRETGGRFSPPSSIR